MRLLKPMLAAKLTEGDLASLRFPLIASPKLDGIRCLIQNGKAWTRNLKPIPNVDLRDALTGLPDGLDGELVIPGEPFSEVSSVVMSEHCDRDSLVEYWVFDVIGLQRFARRAEAISKLLLSEGEGKDWVRPIPQLEVGDLAAVRRLEERWVGEGFEGIILRDPDGRYKHGRSTIREQGLLKFKRFDDSEARIVGFVEQQANLNPAKRDRTGKLKRSSAKAGKVGKGVLGTLVVIDEHSGVRFEVGSGFTDAQRIHMWANRKRLLGCLVKYKHQESGAKVKPRFPVFLGLRSRNDL